MELLDLLLAYGAAIDTAVSTAQWWGPPVVLVGGVVAWWRLRPPGLRRHVRTPKTSVPALGDRHQDTAPGSSGGGALTCADTRPDVSVDDGPDVSGPELGGGH